MGFGTKFYYSNNDTPETWSEETARISSQITDSLGSRARIAEIILSNPRNIKESIYTPYLRCKLVEREYNKTIFLGRVEGSEPLWDDNYGQCFKIALVDYSRELYERKLNANYLISVNPYWESPGKRSSLIKQIVYDNTYPDTIKGFNIEDSGSSDLIKRDFTKYDKAAIQVINELACEDYWTDETWTTNIPSGACWLYDPDADIWSLDTLYLDYQVTGTGYPWNNPNAFQMTTSTGIYRYFGMNNPFLGIHGWLIGWKESNGDIWEYYSSSGTWKELNITESFSTATTDSSVRWDLPDDWCSSILSTAVSTSYYTTGSWSEPSGGFLNNYMLNESTLNLGKNPTYTTGLFEATGTNAPDAISRYWVRYINSSGIPSSGYVLKNYSSEDYNNVETSYTYYSQLFVPTESYSIKRVDIMLSSLESEETLCDLGIKEVNISGIPTGDYLVQVTGISLTGVVDNTLSFIFATAYPLTGGVSYSIILKRQDASIYILSNIAGEFDTFELDTIDINTDTTLGLYVSDDGVTWGNSNISNIIYKCYSYSTEINPSPQTGKIYAARVIRGCGYDFYVNDDQEFIYRRRGSVPYGGAYASGFNLRYGYSVTGAQTRGMLQDYSFADSAKELVTRVTVRAIDNKGSQHTYTAANTGLENKIQIIKERTEFLWGKDMSSSEVDKLIQTRAQSDLQYYGGAGWCNENGETVNTGGIVKRGNLSTLKYPYTSYIYDQEQEGYNYSLQSPTAIPYNNVSRALEVSGNYKINKVLMNICKEAEATATTTGIVGIKLANSYLPTGSYLVSAVADFSSAMAEPPFSAQEFNLSAVPTYTLFKDSFEWGNHGDPVSGFHEMYWIRNMTGSSGTTDYYVQISTAQAYSGTRSVELYHISGTYANIYTYLNLPEDRKVNFGMRCYKETSGQSLTIYYGNGSYRIHTGISSSKSGAIFYVDTTGSYHYLTGVSYSLTPNNEWFKLDFKNIDFTNFTYDIYLNDLEFITGVPMAQATGNFKQVWFAPGTGYFWIDDFRAELVNKTNNDYIVNLEGFEEGVAGTILSGGMYGSSYFNNGIRWAGDGVTGAELVRISSAFACSGSNSIELYRTSTGVYPALYTFLGAADNVYEIDSCVYMTGTPSSFTIMHGSGSKRIYVYKSTSSNKLSWYGSAYVNTDQVLSSGAWYKIGLKNINFTSGTYDIYLDDVLVSAGADMNNSTTAGDRLEFRNNGDADTSVWVDNVSIRFCSGVPVTSQWIETSFASAYQLYSSATYCLVAEFPSGHYWVNDASGGAYTTGTTEDELNSYYSSGAWNSISSVPLEHVVYSESTDITLVRVGDCIRVNIPSRSLDEDFLVQEVVYKEPDSISKIKVVSKAFGKGYDPFDLTSVLQGLRLGSDVVIGTAKINDLWVSDANIANLSASKIVVSSTSDANTIIQGLNDYATVLIEPGHIGVSGFTMDTIADGTTYQKLRATDIYGGHIRLTQNALFSGTWYNQGAVTIDALTGISLSYASQQRIKMNASGIAGYNSAGVLQFAIDTISGGAVCGGGNIRLNASGIYGYNGYIPQFYISAANGKAYFVSGYATIGAEGIKIDLPSINGSILLNDYGIHITGGAITFKNYGKQTIGFLQYDLYYNRLEFFSSYDTLILSNNNVGIQSNVINFWATSGRYNFHNIPQASSGLQPGDLYIDTGFLKVVGII